MESTSTDVDHTYPTDATMTALPADDCDAEFGESTTKTSRNRLSSLTRGTTTKRRGRGRISLGIKRQRRPQARSNAKSGSSQDAIMDKDYIIEKVLGTRVVNGEEQVYIKWQGFDASYNTWEPLSNVNEATLNHLKKMKENQEPEQGGSNATNASTSLLSVNSIEVGVAEKGKISCATDVVLTTNEDTRGNTVVFQLKNLFDNPKMTFRSICGATPIDIETDDVAFIVAFDVDGQTSPEFDLVPNSIVKQKVPFQLLKFYEDRITFEE